MQLSPREMAHIMAKKGPCLNQMRTSSNEGIVQVVADVYVYVYTYIYIWQLHGWEEGQETCDTVIDRQLEIEHGPRRAPAIQARL